MEQETEQKVQVAGLEGNCFFVLCENFVCILMMSKKFQYKNFYFSVV